MSQTTIDLFEEAIAGLQRAAVTGHYRNGISTEQFVDAMFQVAASLGSVECRPEDENHLCFVIGGDAPRIYEFPVSRGFRSVLGSIAALIWSTVPQTQAHEFFNPYGDKRQVEYTSDAVTTGLYVETANTNGKPLYFIIRKSG
ncbi:MAG TPA: hypothetical protein VF719_07400 [Abditibacteriaceae bacterium]